MAGLLCITGMLLNLTIEAPAQQTEPPKPPPPPAEPLALLQLPDELLLKIARFLDKNNDLRRLSLTNRKLRHVAQETLVKDLVLPNAGIRALLETFCNRPDLREKVNHIDLGLFTFTGRTSPIFEVEKWRYYAECRNVANRKQPGIFDRLGQAVDGYRVLWPDTQLFFLDMLVLMCSNLRRLSIIIPRDDHTSSSHILKTPAEIWAPFPTVASKTLASGLKTLAIAPTGGEHLLDVPSVILHTLAHVTCLRIPSTLIFPIWPRARGAAFIARVLPPNLKCLQLAPCHQAVLVSFSTLAECLQNGFPQLEHLDLYFDLSLRETIGRIARRPNVVQRFLDAGNRLVQEKGMQIRAFNYSQGAYIGDFMDELDAWVLLTDLERWYPSREGNFSSIVARTDRGLPRKRTKEEVRMFLRRHGTQATKPRPFAFTPKVRFDSCSKFYDETREEQREVVFSDDFINSSRHMLTQLHRLQAIQGRIILPKRVHGHRVQKFPITASQGKFTFRCTNSNHPWVFRFDPKEWLGVTFFDRQMLDAIGNGNPSPVHEEMRKRKHKPGQPVGLYSRFLKRNVKAKLLSDNTSDEEAQSSEMTTSSLAPRDCD